MPDRLPRADLLADATALAARALAEDGEVDVTSEVTVPLGQHGQGILEVRRDTVLAGMAYAEAVAAACRLDAIEWAASEGEFVAGGTAPTRMRCGIRVAASSTRARRRRACACWTSRRCSRAAVPCTGSTSRTP